MYLLSDNTDTLIGMRLAGIEGKIVKDAVTLRETIKSDAMKDVAILLITKPLAELDRAYIDEMKQKNCPLVVEVPDRKHCDEDSDSITRYVRDAMGIKF